MMGKVRIALVSYSNTLPFLYGIQKDEALLSQVDLRLEYPSKCADLLKTGKVDVSLIPVIEIPNIPRANIIADYCIGSIGKVNTVMLYSDCPIEKIQSIALDYQSRTSIMLVKVLAKYFWNINVQYEETSEGYIDSISGTKAGVVIGDRTFRVGNTFAYKYDLSLEWEKFTGLPFVFACWVSTKPLTESFQKQFNSALEFGLNQKESSIESFSNTETNRNSLKEYLNESISYPFDAQKKEALKKFLSLAQTI
jgi:chorismate dehydratase